MLDGDSQRSNKVTLKHYSEALLRSNAPKQFSSSFFDDALKHLQSRSKTRWH